MAFRKMLYHLKTSNLTSIKYEEAIAYFDLFQFYTQAIFKHEKKKFSSKHDSIAVTIDARGS